MAENDAYLRFLATLREEIRSRKLRQKDVAKQLNKTGSWLSAILHGRRGMDVAHLLKIAEVLGIPARELLPGDQTNCADIDAAIKEKIYSSLPGDVIDYLVKRKNEDGKK